MTGMLNSRKRHHIADVGLFLLVAALIAGLTGCVGEVTRTVKYDITIASGQGGSVAEPGEGTFTCDAGRVVDLVAVPTSGYRFDRWTGAVGTIADVNAPSTTITVNGNYSITATFEETEPTFYTLMVGVAGSGSVSPTAGQHTYAAGAVISIIATPAGGYHFVAWSGDMGTIANVNAASTTITMNDDYSIIANFDETAVTYYTLTMAATGSGSASPAVGQHTYAAGTVVPIIATPAGGYYFVNWTGSVITIANVNAASTTIAMNGNYSVTANFAVIPPGQYSLTISSSAGGSVTTPGQGIFIYGPGTVVNLVATPAGGYEFVNWTGNVGTIANVTAASTTITMNNSYSITANFSGAGPPVPPGQYTLTMAVTGSGSTSPAVGPHTYTAGTLVPIVATPAGGYQFVSWTAPAGSFTNSNSATTTFTMPAQNVTATAHFVVVPPVQYTLTMAVAGGGSTSPAVGQHAYSAGTVVPIVATAAGGYRFVNWVAPAGTFGSATAATTTFTMPAQNVTVTANFVPVYSLSMAVAPGGSGTATDLTNASPYTGGAVVNIQAVATAGYTFTNWTAPAGTFGSATAATTTFTMPAQSVTATANFALIPPTQYTLIISSTAGGSVTTPGEGTFTRNASTVVSLAATPAAGYAFVNWTGNVGTIADVNDAYTTITMSGNYSVTANFMVGDWVFFPDPELEAALRAAIGRPTGRIYKSDLNGLTSFSATGRSIADLTGLEYCINLVTLDLHDNQIGDISALAGLTKLEWLDLSYNRIGNISPLTNLVGLKWLYLHNNQIGNISPLANLTNLTYLFLYMNQIGNISPLANLTNLTRLLLFSNQISDISPLTNLTKLTWLYLQKNQISSIGSLANLTSLTQLDLSYNQIASIAALSNLIDLAYLSLQSNHISDTSVLANLTNLMWLYLQNNDISNIYPLVQNGGLGTGDRVYLHGNPLSVDSINIYIPQLAARGVIVSY